MSGRTAVSLRGEVRVALPPGKAFELFTPSGERRWAGHADPRFPSPPEDEARPGTVFAGGYPAFLRGWEEAIEGTVTRG